MAEANPAAKARWKTQIEHSLANGNFAEAMTLVHKAFAEFADDPEFLALEERVTHGRDRSVTVFQMMEEGRQLCSDQNFDEGLHVLRSAYALDERNALARSTLIDNLLCRALAILESDLPQAEQLAQEATALDPGNPVNKSVALSIQEYRQNTLANQTPPPTSAPSANSAGIGNAATLKAEGAGIGESIPRASAKAVEAAPFEPARAMPVPPAATGPNLSNRAAAPTPVGGAPISSRTQQVSSRADQTISERVPVQLPSSAPAQPTRSSSQSSSQSAPAKTTPGSTPSRAQATRKSGAPSVSSASAGRTRVPSWVWAVAGIAALALGVSLIRTISRRAGSMGYPVSVSIQTKPSGAVVRINGKDYDTTQEVSLMPGRYRIEAALDGYQPMVRDVDISKTSRDPIELNLIPPAPLLRISTDFASGAVSLDGNPAGNLQDGQFSIDSIAPGEHSLRISSGQSAEAVIPISVLAAGAPVLAGAVIAKNLRVFLLGSFEGQGYAYGSFGPALLKLDGQSAGEISAAKPLQLAGLTAASHEFLFVEGKSQRKISLDVNPARSMYVSLTSDRNVGMLEVVSNESGFQLQINGKTAKFNTQRGHYFVYNLDAKSNTVQISKAGFDTDPSAQEVVIKKGETARASFKLTPTPTTATLRVSGVLPGTRVSVDGALHELLADGSILATLTPGEHAIEFTRQGFKPKTAHISVKAGQTIALGGNDVMANDAATGKLTITGRSPANATVVLRRGGTESPIPDRETELPEGDYTLVATASGFREESRPVRIAEGAPAAFDIKLAALPQLVRMEGWDDSKGWRLEDGWYTRKGGNFVLFKGSATSGTIQFTARHKGRQLPIFRGGQIRWVVNYVDAQNYDLYELDGQRLSWKRVADGKPGPEKQSPHSVKIQNDTYRVTLEVGADQLAGKIFDGKSWKSLPLLDANTRSPKEGRFGFFLPNNEEMWLTDFVFKPNE